MSYVDTGQSPDRLDGWKDIASYLNKSVRTAIRWEKQLGLPVRRLHTASGEVVYAFRSEIDEWLRANPPAARENGEPETPHEVEAAPVTRAALTTPLRSTQWLAGAAVFIGLIALAMTLTTLRRTSGNGITDTNPAGYRFEPSTLVVTNKADQVLWRRQFNFRIDQPPFPDYHSSAPDEQFIALSDIDDDGRSEVIVRSFAQGRGGWGSLWAFDSDGRHRFEYRVTDEKRYGTNTYGPPFSIVRMLVPSGIKDAPVLVAAQHQVWFPCVVRALSPTGRVVSEYWTNGHIDAIGTLNLAGHMYFAVGGIDNERRWASLAVVDPDKAAAFAPAETSKYRCATCGGGAPFAFMMFPISAVATTVKSDPYVTEITQEPDGNVRVCVLHHGGYLPGDANRSTSSVYYRFNQKLQLLDVTLGNDFSEALTRAVILRLLTRAQADNEAKLLSAVYVWNGGHFTKIEATNK